MGTRSLTHIKEDGKTLVTLYRQFDGYPTGMGKDIKAALNDGNARLTNGFGGDDAIPAVFNGMGCLAAGLIKGLKEGIGNVYIYPADSDDCGEEYTYTVYYRAGAGDSEPFSKPTGVICLKVVLVGWKDGGEPNRVMYDGPLSEFDPEKVEAADRDSLPVETAAKPARKRDTVKKTTK